jgi:predicted dithiol-disulfide oxidoreductase (DUF899 family)
MFDPAWDAGCEGCSIVVDNIGHLAHLHARDTSLVLVSRAPLPKLLAYQKRMGWTVPCYSFGSEFNYDFHVTGDDSTGEGHGLSALLRGEADVFHGAWLLQLQRADHGVQRTDSETIVHAIHEHTGEAR